MHMNDGWEGEDARLFPDAGQGVKFYSLSECGTTPGVLVKFVRRPDNCRDKNCVEVRVAGVGSERCAKLGHVAAEVVE